MLDTRHLRHFVAVAQELHFGRAARRLNISQPPLSISVKKLEEQLGLPLFIRTQRSVALTTAGKVLLERALPILLALEDAATSAQASAKGYEGVLRIGYTAASAYEVVPKVIAAYQASYPLVELVLHEMVSSAQLVALRQQQIDVGVMRPLPFSAPLRSVCLSRESLVLALPSTHPLAKESRVSLACLDGQAFIGFNPSDAPYFHAMVEEVMQHAQVRPKTVQRATQTHAVVALVAAGLGLALVPETCMRICMENLTFRPLAELLDSGAEVHLCWNRSNDASLIANFVTKAQSVLMG